MTKIRYAFSRNGFDVEIDDPDEDFKTLTKQARQLIDTYIDAYKEM
jgi:hypothetical protein